ncbi:hypothetical protein BJ508DRAFT_334081 [Ascobolus immersus RN42]|uniref:Uncharacterized protein n=1 Tax=Ascobolus immersus RN42 TaxID=1160509 RepID=A0A3N4HHC8_ASCIM|nr:hypothetical protein BJ508DRAFT_334081 [Ascobolus immersus RN42]
MEDNEPLDYEEGDNNDVTGVASGLGHITPPNEAHQPAIPQIDDSNIDPELLQLSICPTTQQQHPPLSETQMNDNIDLNSNTLSRKVQAATREVMDSNSDENRQQIRQEAHRLVSQAVSEHTTRKRKHYLRSGDDSDSLTPMEQLVQPSAERARQNAVKKYSKRQKTITFNVGDIVLLAVPAADRVNAHRIPCRVLRGPVKGSTDGYLLQAEAGVLDKQQRTKDMLPVPATMSYHKTFPPPPVDFRKEKKISLRTAALKAAGMTSAKGRLFCDCNSKTGKACANKRHCPCKKAEKQCTNYCHGGQAEASCCINLAPTSTRNQAAIVERTVESDSREERAEEQDEDIENIPPGYLPTHSNSLQLSAFAYLSEDKRRHIANNRLGNGKNSKKLGIQATAYCQQQARKRKELEEARNTSEVAMGLDHDDHDFEGNLIPYYKGDDETGHMVGLGNDDLENKDLDWWMDELRSKFHGQIATIGIAFTDAFQRIISSDLIPKRLLTLLGYVWIRVPINSYDRIQKRSDTEEPLLDFIQEISVYLQENITGFRCEKCVKKFEDETAPNQHPRQELCGGVTHDIFTFGAKSRDGEVRNFADALRSDHEHMFSELLKYKNDISDARRVADANGQPEPNYLHLFLIHVLERYTRFGDRVAIDAKELEVQREYIRFWLGAIEGTVQAPNQLHEADGEGQAATLAGTGI